MIKLSVKLNGVETELDRALIPTDSTGRHIEFLKDSIVDGVYEVDTELYEEAKAIVAKAELKRAKADILNSITVTTTNGNTFDGNKTSRVNLLAEIMSYEVLGEEEVTWHLADNSDVKVTITELKEALALSIREAGRIVKAKTMEEL